MAPRGGISRPQRWDPDVGPEEGHTGGPKTLLFLYSLSLSLSFSFSYHTDLSSQKRAALVGRPMSVGVRVASMPFSPCLAPSQLVCTPCFTSSLSASSARLTSWFLFIVLRWVLMLPPSDVVLSTSRVFALGYIGWVYGGFRPATYII